MGTEYRSRTFKSGNSVALRLPKGLSIPEGVEMTVREAADGYVFQRVPETPQRIDLTGIYGSIPGLQPLTRDERAFEPRELDWDGKRLERG